MHEKYVWSAGLRNPWVEALPSLNSVCPLFTHRRGSSLHPEDASSTIERALTAHQRCQPYLPVEDNNICFHITFYEFIHASKETDFENEIWKIGRLHSDDALENRRIRESACTVITNCCSILGLYPKQLTKG
jgi:hypothetical protein